MKIQIVSDLHLEFLTVVEVLEVADRISYKTNADVLVLAGDICSLNKRSSGNFSYFLDAVQEKYKDIIYVMGNHEYYGTSYSDVKELMRRTIQYRPNTPLTVLENKSITIGDITFYGTTLWFEETVQSSLIRYNLNDYKCIKDFTPDEYCREAIKFIKSIEDTESKKVLITHHVPHSGFISPRYVGNEMNCFYLNEVGKYLDKFDLVTFGHSHDSVRQQFSDRCLALSNPRGYVNFPSTEGENENFEYQLIVEV